jgi:hypothetical protein
MFCFAQIQPLSNNDNLSLSLCRNKNGLVRAAASRLLTLVIITSGADKELGPTAKRTLNVKLFQLQPLYLTMEIQTQGISFILTAAKLFGDNSLERSWF